MKERFITQPAKLDDSPQIVDMLRQLADYCESDMAEFGVTEDMVTKTISEDGNENYVVARSRDSERDLLGMVHYGQTPTSWNGNSGIYVEDLFVTSENRGIRGVGKALLASAAQSALLLANNDPSKAFLRLDTGRHNNDPTLGFYNHLGFTDHNVNLRLSGVAFQQLLSRK